MLFCFQMGKQVQIGEGSHLGSHSVSVTETASGTSELGLLSPPPEGNERLGSHRRQMRHRRWAPLPAGAKTGVSRDPTQSRCTALTLDSLGFSVGLSLLLCKVQDGAHAQWESAIPQALPLPLSSPEHLGREAGELMLGAAAHPSSGTSRPGVVLEEAPGGPWAGPARGWGAGVCAQGSWVTQGGASCCHPHALQRSHVQRSPGGGTCPLALGLCTFPLPWETSFRGPSPRYKQDRDELY